MPGLSPLLAAAIVLFQEQQRGNPRSISRERRAPLASMASRDPPAD